MERYILRGSICLLLAAGGVAWGETPSAIGAKVGELRFKDIRFLPRSLKDFGEKKAYAFVAISTTCPEAPQAVRQMESLRKKFADQKVQCVCLDVDPNDSIREMAAQAVQYEAEAPFVMDAGGDAAKALGLSETGQAALLDDSLTLRYRGGLDGLEGALADVLAGRKVAVPQTPAKGTPIPPAARDSLGAVNFAEHVAPIMKQHCQECHRSGTEAPFSLISYADVAGNAEMVAEVVSEERMPPWYASDKHGSFANKRALTRKERETVAAWVRAGRPEGDLSKAPAPIPAAQNKWQIGQPDFVASTTRTYTLPKTGYVPYEYAILPILFRHDTWVSAVEILPDNPRVVHHCNMAYASVGANWGKADFITGRVPGVQPMNLEEGLGFLIPKGSILILQIHFTTTGKDEKCKISVGFRYPRHVVRKQFHMLWMVDTKFAIPPGAPAYRAVGLNTIPCDAIGFGLFAHMHLRGRDMSFIAHYPDGRNETLLMIPNFSFDWQMGYQFEGRGKRFPKGTKLEAVAHYDNSPFNPYNPDPKATVKEGQQTFQEMLNGVFFYIDEKEDLNITVDPKTGRAVEPTKTVSTNR